MEQNQGVYDQKLNGHTAVDAIFEMCELKRALT